MALDGGAIMAYYTPYEEQEQCCYSEECENTADNRVLVFNKFNSVCDEHKEDLEQWIADSLT